MLLRRIVALLTMFSLLHLTVAAGEASCASHAPGAAAMGAGDGAGAHAGHDMAAPVASSAAASQVHGEDAAPCDMAADAPCCEAMMPCADQGVTSTANAAAATAPEPAARIAGAGTDAPASFAPPPEPPPPKG